MKICRWTLICASMVGLFGCKSEDDQLSEELWGEIGGESLGYRSWAQFPGYEAPMLSDSHAGYTVRTFINDIASDFVSSGEWTGQMPGGTVVVKESFYSTDGQDISADLRNITVMWKVEGYAADTPETNNWFYVNFNPNGNVGESETGKIQGQPTNCIDCHTGVKDNDYIYLYDFTP